MMRDVAPNAYLLVDETYRDASYGVEDLLPSAAALGPRVITGASVSKAYGAPGLRAGWLTVREPDLRERLMVAKMNTVISGSPLDETLAAAVIENRHRILEPRRSLLAAGRTKVADWVTSERGRVEWVKPQGGALCCLRLSPAAFDDEGIRRFWAALPAAELQLGNGAWFGEVLGGLPARVWVSPARRSSGGVGRTLCCDRQGRSVMTAVQNTFNVQRQPFRVKRDAAEAIFSLRSIRSKMPLGMCGADVAIGVMSFTTVGRSCGPRAEPELSRLLPGKRGGFQRIHHTSCPDIGTG